MIPPPFHLTSPYVIRVVRGTNPDWREASARALGFAMPGTRVATVVYPRVSTGGRRQWQCRGGARACDEPRARPPAAANNSLGGRADAGGDGCEAGRAGSSALYRG